MKTKWIYTALACLVASAAFAQSSRGEFVSQRMADAISSGKYYLKMSGLVTEEEDGQTSRMIVTTAMAVKDGVEMTRMDDFNVVTLQANGYAYQLDEKNKSYTVSKLLPDEPVFAFGKLTFKGQGTCTLNGAKYHYDEWRASSGHTLTFYYNTTKVTAISFGMEEKGIGVMSLLAFNTRIPDDMYFCLGNDWKLNDPTNIDVSQYVEGLDEMKVEGLPEGINMKDLVGGKVDQKALLKDLLKDEDLPQGMNLDDIMGMVSAASGTNPAKQFMQNTDKNKEEMRAVLKQQGMTNAQIEHTLKHHFPDQQMVDVFDQHEALSAEIANAPPPPRCTSSWRDPAQECELSAGANLGTINVAGQAPLSPYVYLDGFSEPQTLQASLSMDVTDEGIWQAFDLFAEETKNMNEQEAATYIMNYSNDAVLCAEMGCVTGQMIERAIVTCMLCPSAATYNNAGLLFFYKDDTENALQYYQKAEEMDGENATILLNIAECFFQLGDYRAARRYADRSVSHEPEYGLAFQLLTSINLAEKNYILATETLLKGAATYFSDVTATHFFSLEMMMRTAPAKICDGFNAKALFDQVFSPKNLDLLTLATRAGFTSNGQDIPANQKTLAWPMNNATVHSTYMSLANKQKEHDALLVALTERDDELVTNNPILNAYMLMGTQEIQGELDAVEDLVNSVQGMPFKIKVPDVPNIPGYRLASQMASQGADGNFLLNSRQYWCLQLWKTYYELLYDYSAGHWTCFREDKMIGYWPDSFTTFEQRKKDIDKSHENDMRIYGGWVQPCYERYDECMERATTERQALQCYVNKILCLLPQNKKYIHTLFGVRLIEHLDAEQGFYTSTIKPVLEEYWLKMNAMAGYCDDLALREYFLNDVMHFINWKWQPPYMSKGIASGELIDHEWVEMVLNLEREIERQLSIMEQLPADPPKSLEKKDLNLSNYGEKKTLDIEVGFTSPFGRLSLSRQNNQYSVGYPSLTAGTTKVHNLTTGEKKSMTTYETLADRPGSQTPKGYAQSFAEWGAKKGLNKMVDAVGKAIPGSGIRKFVPYSGTESTRQRMRTIDSEGNITDSGTVRFRERSMGVGNVGVGVGQTQVRTGNSIRTQNHVRMRFNLLDVKLSK